MNTKQKFQIQKWTTEVHFSKHDVFWFLWHFGKVKKSSHLTIRGLVIRKQKMDGQVHSKHTLEQGQGL